LVFDNVFSDATVCFRQQHAHMQKPFKHEWKYNEYYEIEVK